MTEKTPKPLRLDKMPDGVGRTTIIDKEQGLIGFLIIEQNEFCDNPLELSDGLGTIKSFSTRHGDCIRSQEELDSILEENPDCVFLSYFEHGECKWGVKGSINHYPDFQWDGIGNAGIWIPDQSVLDSTELQGDERREWMEKQAQDACDLYTNWSNGQVFSYSFLAYNLRSHNGNDLDRIEDYRFDDEFFADESCSEICGWDNLVKDIRDHLGHLIDNESEMIMFIRGIKKQ